MPMKQEQPKGHGYLKDSIEYGTDYVFGSAVSLGNKKKFAGVVLEADGDWEKRLFPEVYTHQAPKYETNTCTIATLLNAGELLNYRVHGKTLDLSERDVAVGAGIDPARGATFKLGAEWFRKNWAVFEHEWSAKDAETLEEYYTAPPPDIRAKGKERGKQYTFGYEYISNPTFEKIEEALRYGPVGFSTAYMRRPDGLWERPQNWNDGHAVLVIKAIRRDGIKILRILDSYPFEGSFLKDLIFHVPDSAMRYALDELKYDLLTRLLSLLKQLYEMLKKNAVNIVPPPAYEVKPESLPINQPDKNYITPMAKAMKQFEDYVPKGGAFRNGTPAPNGSISWRNKNPGNLKLGSYTRDFVGRIGTDSSNHIIFDNYENGWNALEGFLKNACNGKYAKYRADGSIKQFFTVYQEASADIYASYVCNYMSKELGETIFPSKPLN